MQLTLGDRLWGRLFSILREAEAKDFCLWLFKELVVALTTPEGHCTSSLRSNLFFSGQEEGEIICLDHLPCATAVLEIRSSVELPYPGWSLVSWSLNLCLTLCCGRHMSIANSTKPAVHQTQGLLKLSCHTLAFKISFLLQRTSPELHPPAVGTEISTSITDFFLSSNAQRSCGTATWHVSEVVDSSCLPGLPLELITEGRN